MPTISQVAPGARTFEDLARADPQVLEKAIWGSGLSPKAADALRQAVGKTARDLLAAGEELPAFNAQGMSRGFSDGNHNVLDRDQSSNLTLRNNIGLAGQTLSDTEGLSQDDFTFKPTFEKDPGSYDVATEGDVNQVRTDSTGLDAQRDALLGYREALGQGGLTVLDRARFADSQRMREQEARGQREAVMGRAEQMGRAGGNASLLAQLTSNQGATNRMANDELQMQALGLQRQDSLRGAYGQLGGQVQGAQDVIDRFNTQGQMDRGMRMAQATTGRNNDVWNGQRDTERGNANIANAAEGFNKSSTGGNRGRVGAVAGAREGVMGTNSDYVNQNNAIEGREAAALQERNRVDSENRAAVLGAINTGVQAFQTGVKTYKDLK